MYPHFNLSAMLFVAIILSLCAFSQASPTLNSNSSKLRHFPIMTLSELESSIYEAYPEKPQMHPRFLQNLCGFIPFCVLPTVTQTNFKTTTTTTTTATPSLYVVVETATLISPTTILSPIGTVTVTQAVHTDTAVPTTITTTATTQLGTVVGVPHTVSTDFTTTNTITASPSIVTVTYTGPTAIISPTTTVTPFLSTVTVTPTIVVTAFAEIVVSVTPAVVTSITKVVVTQVTVNPTATITVDKNGSPIFCPPSLKRIAGELEVSELVEDDFAADVEPTQVFFLGDVVKATAVPELGKEDVMGEGVRSSLESGEVEVEHF